MPGLPEAATRLGLSPLPYMRTFGAFLVDDQPSKLHEGVPRATDLEGAVTDPVSGVIRKDGTAVGVEIETLRDWR